MNRLIIALHRKLMALSAREEGQDLVEYALIVALLAFGTAAGMRGVALGINGEFARINTTLASYL